MKAQYKARRYDEMLQYLSVEQRFRVFVALGCSGALDGGTLDEAALTRLLSTWNPPQSETRLQ